MQVAQADYDDLVRRCHAAEEALSLKNAALNTAHNGIVMTDMSGIVTYANQAALNLWGYDDISQVVGQSVMNFGESPDEIQRIKGLLQISGSWSGEMTARRHDGTPLILDISMNLYTDSLGQPAGTMASIIDMSERKRSEAEILQQKTLLQAIIENATEAIYAKDLTGAYLTINEAGARMLGYPAYAVIGHTDHELLPAAINEKFREADEIVLQHGRLDERDETGEIDGKTCIFHTRKSPWRDHNGAIIGLLGVSRNITGRKRAEERIRQNEALITSVLNSSLSGIMAFKSCRDAQGVIVDFEWQIVNAVAESMVSMSQTDLIGQRLLEVMPGNKEDGLFDFYVKVVETGITLNHEHYYEHEKVQTWFHTVAVKLGDGFVVTFTNITEYKQAEATLQQQESLLQSITDNLDDLIFIKDQECRFIFMNPGGYRFNGTTPEQLLGRTKAEFHPNPEQISHIAVDDKRVLASGRMETFEEVLIAADGTRHVFITTKAPRFDGQGNIIGLIGIAHDITERKRVEESLTETLHTLKATIDALPDIMFEVDVEGRIYAYHKPDKQELYVLPDVFMGKTVTDVLPPDAASIIMEALAQTALDGVHHGASYALDISDGRHWYELSIARKPNADIQKSRFVLLTRDITSRKQMEEALRESEHRLRTLADNLPNAVLCQAVGDIHGHRQFTYISDAVTRVNEVSVESVLADANMLYSQVLPAYRSGLQQAEETTIRDGVTLHHEFQACLPSGSIRWFALSGSSYALHDGRVMVSSVQVDITDRKRAEERLQRITETVLHLGQETAANIAILVALCGELLQADCALYNCLNGDRLCVKGRWHAPPDLPDDDMPQGHICFDVLQHPDDSPYVIRQLADTPYALSDPNVRAYGLQTYIGHTVCMGGVSHGSLCVVFTRDVAPTDDDLRVIGIVSAAIAQEEERRQVEEDREKLQAQLSQAQKMESVGRLAGGVAHDFNNMLGVILGYTELAIKQLDATAPIQNDLAEIKRAAERSANLTRQLLAFARKQTVAPKILDLNDAVSSMLKMLQRLIGENIEIAWQPGPNLERINIDPAQIDQILANLCVNARDAINGVGKITLETLNISVDGNYINGHTEAIPGDFVMLAIIDNGCGMDAEIQSHLFEPFYTSKGVGEGTGLGLATVYGIVKQNGGFINVESKLGKGTTFNIFFPRYTASPLPHHQASASLPDDQRTETVLLVEDEKAILALATRVLKQHGYQVIAVCTPTEAMDWATQHEGALHLLLTDVVMPHMNGRELAERLQARHPHMKCLFMSGYTADVIAHHGVLDAGIHFLQKPFTNQDLLAMVRAVLSGEETQHTN